MRRPLLLTLVALSMGLLLLPGSFTDGPRDHSEFVYARIRYHMTPDAWMVREPPWHHDYPYGDETFPTVLAEVTNVKTSRESFKIVDIDSPELFKYPFAYLSEPGYLELTDKDAANLREWLDRGGFLIADDMRTSESRGFGRRGSGPGEDDLANLRAQMRKVYPNRDFVRLELSDQIFQSFYTIRTLNMEPPYVFAGQGPVEFLGMRDPHGNIQIVVDNNNDISEYWEWLDQGERSMHEAATSLHFAVNYAIYALTH